MSADVDTFPCSFAQRRLWFLNRLIAGEHVYNISAALRFRRPVDLRLLQLSVDALVERHESLRTTFRDDDGEPVQCVAATLAVQVAWHDLSAAGEEAPRFAAAAAEDEARHPFDLERGPLLRVGLLRLGASDFVMLVTMHHIISDGWSTEIFFRELWQLYDGFGRGERTRLPPLPVQYADFAVWQRDQLSDAALDEHLTYWRNQLAAAPPLTVPGDRPRPAVSSYRGDREMARFAPPLADAVDACAQSNQVTPFMVGLTAFAVLLARYARQDDLLIGTLTAGRTRTELEPVIGFFVNTLPLRLDLSASPTFREALARVKDVVVEAQAHGECPFEKLVEELQPERDLSRNPLVQVTFQIFTPPGAGVEGAEEEVEPAAELLEVGAKTAKFDLALDVWIERRRLVGRLEYNEDLFDRGRARRLLAHFETLLAAAVSAPDTPIDALPMLTAAERAEVLAFGNGSAADSKAPPTVLERLAAQVRQTPTAPAVVHDLREWTYQALDRAAASVCAAIVSRGIPPGSRIGVCLERSFPLVAALVGIWRAGAAYVPLDPDYPTARLRLMAADSGAALILTDGRRGPFAGDPRTIDIHTIDLDDPPAESLGTQPAPADLAYVLFTSGSTGEPKGVAIEHRNVSALMAWAMDEYSAAELAGVLACTSVCFDLSVFEIFAPLCAGGAVVLMDNALHVGASPDARRVTLINTVPSAIAELARTQALPPNVRVVNLAGEPLSAALVERVFDASRAERVYNLYGPTEDTTYSTGAVIRRGEMWAPTIGRPLPRRQAYVLDAHLQPLPVGVPGELCVGGEGVARGYWQRPALTAERFVAAPFLEGERLYRTGDLARWREDGTLEFLGREDHQVKVRGHRIELGEIEHALQSAPGVGEAAVVLAADGGGDLRLQAFVTSDGEAALDPIALGARLQTVLPRFMMPSSTTVVDRLPLTPNGKVDRRVLAARRPAKPAVTGGEPMPRTAMEQAIARVWCEILGLPVVGVSQSFFELGGHSLLMLRVHSRLREIAPAVTLLDLFRYPTVEELARNLTAGATAPDPLVAARARAERQRERLTGSRVMEGPS